MENLKVVNIKSDFIEFENGIFLSSEHIQDCCENHYLSFDELDFQDFEGMEFNLSGDDWFQRIDDYGIALLPIIGRPIRIAGHGSNNGYYSSNLTLELMDKDGKLLKSYDITECQTITD